MNPYRRVPITNAEQVSFDFGEASTVERRGSPDATSVQCYLDDDEVARKFGKRVPSLYADLIDIAVEVHRVDRLAARPRRLPGERSLTVTVPVRCLDLWRETKIRCALSRLICFLTEDQWSITFVPRRTARRPSETQRFLFPEPFNDPVHVALYSGGLDSLAGTAAALGLDQTSHFVCVSAVPNPRHERQQRSQVRLLKSISGGRVTHVRIRNWLQSGGRARQDPFRRTRGFLFLAFGAAVALSANVRRLHVYENGIGAINLPYERDQTGIPNSRAVHPRTLRLFSDLVSLVTKRPFEVLNPVSARTKAEMCLSPHLESFRDLIAETFSCDSYPIRKQGKPQCGVCTSCLLRRVALSNSGLAPLDTTGYLHDVHAEDFQPNRQAMQGLLAMDWQVERLLASMKTADTWNGLLQEFPDLRLTYADVDGADLSQKKQRQESLIRLYRQHCTEWRAFQSNDWMRSIGEAA